MIGRILGGRYEVQERIGGGGMAVVYRARDNYLHRDVAVKVLRSGFAGDEDFLRRFRREAQAAASLSHPNIVGIYDVGDEVDLHYIVMEYIEGPTLKDRIEEAGPLPLDEVFSTAVQICDALSHAHQKRVIHRDIKPHNILLADGQVKVADFGIARAATTTTLVHTGSVIGSAHYFSPEQARGALTDERSDIYSLGVVLYEMVTGKVPFEGETAISVAIKHIQESFPPPAIHRPDLPECLQNIILRAMQKDSLRRYQKVSDLKEDLLNCQKAVEEGHAEVAAPVDVSEEEEDGEVRRRRFSLPMLLFFILLGTMAYAGWWLYGWLNVPTVEVPKVEGMSLSRAQEELDKYDLRYKVDGEVFHPEIQAGYVVEQDPEAGQKVKRERIISLTISRGVRMVEGGVPDVVGMQYQRAVIELEAAGLKAGTISNEHDDEVPQDYVIQQNPRAGTPVAEGTGIDLVISLGPEPKDMPSLIGKPFEEAKATVEKMGLTVGTITRQPDAKPSGTVIAQDPPEGSEVTRGDTVDLTVSEGPAGLIHRDIVSVKVPSGGESPKEVRIVLVDIRGQSTVYTGTHRPGEFMVKQIEWAGETARIQVYVDGEKYAEESLPRN